MLSIDQYFDKIFYINLRKDVLRNESLLNQFAKLDIQNYERVEGIELVDLPHISQFRNFNKLNSRYVLGQLSCRASHIKCVQIALERNYTRVLILEDDVVFLEHPNTILSQNEGVLNDWDMLYFGGVIEHHFRNQIVCAHAYGVKNTLFNDIVFMGRDSGMEIDNFYAKILHHMSYNGNQSGKYNIRIIHPFNTIIQNKDFASNIQL